MRSVTLFLAWGVVGFIGSFALLYGFTPVGPLIVLLIWLAYRFLPGISGSRNPEILGAVGGSGAFFLFLASTVDDPSILVILGVACTAASATSYVALGRRRRRATVATG